MKKYVDPINDLGPLLLKVEKPGRYTGGEYGRLADKDLVLQTVIAFPDLYEIGMSNKALRIIYNNLNRTEGISCDRVFAPAPDFETLLREKNFPLYGLETGISPGACDILMFTLGYELGITNVLNILDLGGLSVKTSGRGKTDPITIMGGPCVSNPLPYSEFMDFFWIGEAEAGFFDLMTEIRDIKKRGGDRDEMKQKFLAHPNVWSSGKKEAARAVFSGFGSADTKPAVFPVPVMKVIQQHGAVEIMRGCPNGCRFCHAGFWYRPMRQKEEAAIRSEAASFVNDGGYTEISLSSLSTGDYCGIGDLVENLNSDFKKRHVSFQLPSLKVSSFSLPLLEKVSEVRKSGLTFAIETPDDLSQIAINKKASLENVVAIIQEAKARGWKGIKFYFMIGLPLSGLNEEQAIVDFIIKASGATRMNFNINLGTFIPKPHTPYQWAGQISEETARQKLYFIRDKLKPRGHKTGIQDPFISVLEGIISRGSSEVCSLIEQAWEKGCRLDAWTEYLKKDIWEEIIKSNAELIKNIMDPKPVETPVPWNFIKSGVSTQFLKKENERSQACEFTSACIKNCTQHCGACDNNNKIVENIIQDNVNSKGTAGKSETNNLIQVQANKPAIKRDPSLYWIIFSFSKEGKAVCDSHLDLMELFSMAFTRTNMPVLYSSGYNPLPVLEIVSPLALGISSDNEIAAVMADKPIDPAFFLAEMNKSLVCGITIRKAMTLLIPSGVKKHSLSSWLWGSIYENPYSGMDYVKYPDEKKYRLERINSSSHKTYWGLKRLDVLAKDPANPENGKSFFEVFGSLYPNR